MAEFYGPFDSGGGASLDEDEWGDFFGNLFGTGVIKGGKIAETVKQDLAVSAGSGLHSEVGTGVAMVRGWFYRNDATKELTHDAADPSLARIDTIILKLDVAARTLVAAIKKGTAAASPTPPTLTQTASTYEFPLRDVSIPGGATSVTMSTDRRVYSVAVLAGYGVGHDDGDVPVADGTTVTNLNADMTDNHHVSNSSGNIPVSNGTVNTDLNADMVDGHHAGNTSGTVAVANGTVVTDLNADQVDGIHGTALVKIGSHNTASGLSVSAGTATPSALDPHELYFQYTNS